MITNIRRILFALRISIENPITLARTPPISDGEKIVNYFNHNQVVKLLIKLRLVSNSNKATGISHQVTAAVMALRRSSMANKYCYWFQPVFFLIPS